MFTFFLGKIGVTNVAIFQGVCMNDNPMVEDLVQVNICLCNLDFDDGARIGELGRRSIGKHSNTVRPIRYNSHFCYASVISVLFKAYRCPSCYTFLNRAPSLK